MSLEYHLRRIVPVEVARDDGELAVPTAEPSNALTGFVNLLSAPVEAILGNDDLSHSAEEFLAGGANQKYGRKVRIVAVAGPCPASGQNPGQGPAPAADAPVSTDRSAAIRGLEHLPTVSSAVPGTSDGREESPLVALPDVTAPGEVLGMLSLALPDTDNTHLGFVDIAVAQQARKHGIGSALHTLAFDLLRAEGRRTASAWTAHAPAPTAHAPAPPAHAPAPPAHAPAPPVDTPPTGTTTSGTAAALRPPLIPPTGVGAIPQDDDTDWLAHRGWRLEQCERHSILELDRTPEGRARAEQWRAESAARAGADYRLHTWQGVTPPEWRDEMAELLRNMSLDVPQAELDMEEEVWDAQRVLDEDRATERTGLTPLTTAAEHVPTGALVAYTRVEQPGARPAVVYQENTIVLRAHRGHRLGLLVKAVNHLALLDRFEHAERIHTWNAGENAHMLAINELMGFRERTVEGAWQLSVSDDS